MKEGHRDGCRCHGCVCSRYELEIHSLTNDIEHERQRVAELEKERDHWEATVHEQWTNYQENIIPALNAERDAALAEVEVQRNRWEREITPLKSALRAAKEDILVFGNHDLDCMLELSDFKEACTCWHAKAIAAIQAALGET